MTRDKPFWMPDTQGFLAIAIIAVVAGLAYFLLLSKVQFDDKVAGAFMTLLGVLTACLKDVYSFFFGSSKGSEKKDDALISGSITTAPPNGTGPAKTTTTSEPDKVTTTVEPVSAGKAVAMIAVLFVGMTLFAGSSFAQGRPQVTGNIVADTKANLGIGGARPSQGGLNDILGALDDKVLPDLQYALKLATAADSKVTAPCYQAWIDIINKRKVAVTNTDGTPMELPQPRIITDFEKAVELRNALQPDSEFSIKCAPVVAMVKLDILSFMGKVIGGGAGLATMVPGL